jgi:putative membrane protein
MLKYTLPVVALLGLLVVANTARAGEPPAGAAGADTKFVNNAARDGEAEVILGKLAAEKAKSEDVKKFGQQMVDDHTKANEELKAIAKSKEIDLEKAAAMGTKKGERISQKLNKLEGDEFDKGYVAIMIKEHESAVKLFKTQSEKGEDADLKAFAAKTLPTLEHHLSMVKELQSKVGKPAGGGGREGDADKPKLGPTDGEAKPGPGGDRGKNQTD